MMIRTLSGNHTSVNAELIDPTTRYSLMIKALLDSGATDCFIDYEFVNQLKLPLIKLDRAIPVYNVDGSSNNAGSITHKCEVTMRFKDHYELIRLYVTQLGKTNVILGHSWLKRHNAIIDWTNGEITMSRCPSECGRNHMLDDGVKPDQPKTPEFIYHTFYSKLPMRLHNPELGYWTDVEEIPELRIFATTNFATEIAIENAGVQKAFEEAVPNEYHSYRDVFEEKAFQKLPNRRPWDHAIEIIPGVEPHKLTKAYPLSPVEDIAMKEFLDENLASGRIRESNSPWASGFFFVKKKDGKLRPTQDYRALNTVTKKNAYPLPLISELITKLKEAQYFSKMDIRWGFNNIRIKEGDEQKAAFLTSYGLFEPTVMFFGLCNSPATFQSMMNSLLRSLIQRGVVMVYLDDILVYTKTKQEHQQVVREVLEILRKNNLYLKHTKCEFEKEEIEYLGMIVGRGTVRMDPKKVDAIGRWPTPQTVKQIQQFLGFCNFYRNFIDSFANIARPLWNLTQKTHAWNWGTIENDAFNKIKEQLTTQPVLTLPNDIDPFRVEADASDYATGAVLSQHQKGQWKPIAFLSKALSATERNYEIHDRELLAIMRALEEWRHFLQGSKMPIEIYTDHKNLEYFLTA
jgi:RNase H-like domain found in reverse transcriptase/Reverse transcriptase (RNA-dependent DNA polymerase)/Retroviral aspartyl protease